MATQIPPPPPTPPREGVGPAVQEISFRAQQLVREEIELAKAEVSAKVATLLKGAVVGAAGGIFGVVGLLFLLHGLSWGFSDWFSVAPWIGYWITTAILFVLAGLAAFLATRLLKSGSPPKPEMAIDEAQRIKRTVDEARR
jgi:uncharacterized membrane protein YqjE